jgi:hypothetical protein
MAPGSPDHWGRAIGVNEIKHWNGNPQPIVEAANLAFGLSISRTQFWDRLDEKLREQLADWLIHHATKHGSDNNWLLFTAVIEAFLRSAGYDVPKGHAQQDIDLFESWYLGDGWYNDGPISKKTGHGNRVDHYNSWVIQPFLWQWYQLTDQPTERRERFRARLAEFADTYALLFAPDGSPLHQGRSLTYRQAVLGGLWTAALAGVGNESPGATRRLASGVLRHFTTDLGVGAEGAPTLGRAAKEFLPMCQVYSGPGSPYFAGMGFLGLAAPADHALWTEPESPQPSERTNYVRTLHAVGWVIQSADGVVHLANHASDHINDPDNEHETADPHYAALGYSTHTGPDLNLADPWIAPVDGQLALIDEWGRATTRAGLRGTKTGEGWAASWYRPRIESTDVPGAQVVSLSILHQGTELRAHLATTPPGWTVREGSFALADDSEPIAVDTPPTADTATAAATVRTTDARLTVELHPLHGWTSAGIERHHSRNAFGAHSAIPYLTATPTPDVPTLYISLHRLGRTPNAPIPVTVTVDPRTTRFTATWTDGRRDDFALGTLFND